MLKKQSSHIWIIVGVLLILWGLLLININKPYFGHHETPFAWISATVRLFKEYGPQSTNFLPIYTPGPTTPETAEYYLHHPPLIVWFASISAELFGYYPDSAQPFELSLRMVGVIATMLTLAIFYALARRLTSPLIALVAFIFYASAPVTIYFGRMPYYDMVIMPAILLFAYHFLRWMQSYSQRQTIILAIIGIFAMWIDWTAAFYFAVFGVIALIYGNRKQRIGIILIGFAVGIATLAIPVIYAILHEDTLRQLQEVIYTRTISQNVTRTETFSLNTFITGLIAHMLQMLSISTTILGLIGLVILFRRKKTLVNVTMIGLFLGTFIFMVVARNPFQFHDWYKMHYLAIFSIAAAIVAVGAWKLKPEGIKIYAKPLIFAIVFCSLLANIYVLILLYPDVHEFTPGLVAELPEYTQEDDFIATNFNNPIYPIEYYAYRNIRWGVPIEEIVSFYAEEETVDIYYLLYLEADAVNNYDGELSEFDYVILANEFRLIHLTKP